MKKHPQKHSSTVNLSFKNSAHTGSRAKQLSPKDSSTKNLPLSDTEIMRLSKIVEELAVHEDALDLEGIDGFLTGLICGPVNIALHDYLPVMFGVMPIFNNQAQFEEFSHLLVRRGLMIERALAASVEDLNDPRALVPILLDAEDLSAVDDPEGPPAGAYWAAGFMRVLQHWEREWNLLDPHIDAAISPHLDAFLTLCLPPEQWPDDLQPETDEPSQWLAQAIWAAYSIYGFWRSEH